MDGGDALHGPLPRLPWFSILSDPALPWCSLVRAGCRKVSGRTARGAFLQPGNTLSCKRSGFVRLHLRRPSYCGGNLHKMGRRDRTVKKQHTMGRVQLCPDEKAVMLCRNGSPPKPTVGRRHPRHLMAIGECVSAHNGPRGDWSSGVSPDEQAEETSLLWLREATRLTTSW
jgi:hypothetical protein